MSPDHHLFFAPAGEGVSIDERVVVSPCWGRIHPHSLTAGQLIDLGAVIGHLREGGEEVPLVCHARATFVAWFVERGQRVAPGTRIASLRVTDE
ncbi:MAG: hypothetical protein ACRDJ2_08025 [Actinomycetota bacterium]